MFDTQLFLIESVLHWLFSNVKSNDRQSLFPPFRSEEKPPSSQKDGAPGQVNTYDLKPVSFKSNGLPTTASYQELAEEVGKIEGQPPVTVNFNYFKTSELDSIALDEWMKRIQEASDKGKAPDYDVRTQNCATFCIAGFVAGHVIRKDQALNRIPNWLFGQLSTLATENFKMKDHRDHVTHKICGSLDKNGRCP